jgi:hypothetical protein
VTTIIREMREPRIWAKYVEDAAGCWIYQGAIHVNGYGLAHEPGSNRIYWAHRLFWERNHGKVPEGMTLHHKCEVKACVNPEHLAVVTGVENTRLSRGRPRHRAVPRPMPVTVRHGSVATYSNYRCQCRSCLDAWNEYIKGIKKR